MAYHPFILFTFAPLCSLSSPFISFHFFSFLFISFVSFMKYFLILEEHEDYDQVSERYLYACLVELLSELTKNNILTPKDWWHQQWQPAVQRRIKKMELPVESKDVKGSLFLSSVFLFFFFLVFFNYFVVISIQLSSIT